MPLPSQYAQVNVIVQKREGGIEANVLFYVPDGAGAPAIDQAYADSFSTAADATVGTARRAALPSVSEYIGVAIRIHDAGQIFTSEDTTNTGVGPIAGDACPGYAAVVLRKGTSATGRQGRGRWFAGEVPELWTNASTLTGAGEVGMQALVDAFATQLMVGPDLWNAAMLSRTAGTLLPITTHSVHGTLQTQRRRSLRPFI